MPANRDALVKALQSLSVPGLEGSVVDQRMVESLRASGEEGVVVVLSAPEGYPHRAELLQSVKEALHSACGGDTNVTARWKPEVKARAIGKDDLVPGAKNIVLIMSGKGGVGKSTVASNLALALEGMGNRVGLLDADIYGPSVPTMFGITGRPTANGEKIVPLDRFGVKLMSIGFLLEEPHAAVVWRGPMLHSALVQFLKDVDWGELDYLLLDLPPGTGDVALTLSQQVRSTGAVVVTTPQEVALQDVYKSVSMAKKVGIELLGVVENESYFVCDGCDRKHEIFGSGGGEKLAQHAQAPLLGQIPLDPEVRKWGDSGMPVVRAAPDSPTARAFVSVAETLFERVNSASSGSKPISIDRSGGVNRHLPVTR